MYGDNVGKLTIGTTVYGGTGEENVSFNLLSVLTDRNVTARDVHQWEQGPAMEQRQRPSPPQLYGRNVPVLHPRPGQRGWTE